MAQSENIEKRRKALNQICDNLSIIKDYDQAWHDLIQIRRINDINIRLQVVDALTTIFPYVSDKMLAWVDLNNNIIDKNWIIRVRTVKALSSVFPQVPEKKKAWSDLIRLSKDVDGDILWRIGDALCTAFPFVSDIDESWTNLIELLQEINHKTVKMRIIKTLGLAFPHATDKKQAWTNLIKHIKDSDRDVQFRVVIAISAAFPYVCDEVWAWKDLHHLSKDFRNYIRWTAAYSIGLVFPCVQDKEQAWADLHRLALDKDYSVRYSIAKNLGSAFPYVPDKEQAMADLHQLALDDDDDVRIYAYHSLGTSSIFKATIAENIEIYKEEIEKAIIFFENVSKEASSSNPASFCLPFYKSFYTITFQNDVNLPLESEAELKEYLEKDVLKLEDHDEQIKENETAIQEYLIEAKYAIEGSKSKEKLLETVENLAKALKEVQTTSEIGLEAMKCDLNIYRQYCENATNLLDITKEMAPTATDLIRKGLPIIDEKIKKIIADIQKNANKLCKKTQGTSFEKSGIEINRIGIDLLQIRDQIGLIKNINNLQDELSNICISIPEEYREEGCKLLEKAKNEPFIEDKLPLFNMVLSKISTQRIFEKKQAEVSVSLIDNLANPVTIATFFGTVGGAVTLYLGYDKYTVISVVISVLLFIFLVTMKLTKRRLSEKP